MWFDAFANNQTLRCKWVDDTTLRVRIMRPSHPAILTLEMGDMIFSSNGEAISVALFLPARYRLVRTGVVKTEYIRSDSLGGKKTYGER